MIGEFNLYGIYFPWLLVLGVVTRVTTPSTSLSLIHI